MRRPTAARTASIRDVAAAAGVSIATVSNVLNQPERVTARLRHQVEAAIRELGFVRNEAARQLRGGTSRSSAYVVPDLRNPFFIDVARGVEDTLEEHDRFLYLCDSGSAASHEADHLTTLLEQRVQGILLTPVDPDADRIAATARHVPVVLVDRVPRNAQQCAVSVDDIAGGRLAIEHLADRGHHRVAVVGGDDGVGQVQDRLRGAHEAWGRLGRDPTELRRRATPGLAVADGRAAARWLLGLPGDVRPTAVFCVNDLVALGVLQQVIAAGGRVPDDLAIVGYDDIDYAGAAAVPLSSVRQPRQALGYVAAELLVDEERAGHAHQQRVFTPELVARRST